MNFDLLTQALNLCMLSVEANRRKQKEEELLTSLENEKCDERNSSAKHLKLCSENAG